jgi:hypothetical protein
MHVVNGWEWWTSDSRTLRDAITRLQVPFNLIEKKKNY